jgi:predicted nucleic acid-binding Zn ribbon protein
VPEDHRHCKMCGKLVAPGKDVCSAECREKRAAIQRTKNMYTYIIYGLMALLLILFLVRL